MTTRPCDPSRQRRRSFLVDAVLQRHDESAGRKVRGDHPRRPFGVVGLHRDDRDVDRCCFASSCTSVRCIVYVTVQVLVGHPRECSPCGGWSRGAPATGRSASRRDRCARGTRRRIRRRRLRRRPLCVWPFSLYLLATCHCWGGRPDGINCQGLNCEQPRPEPSVTQCECIGVDTSKAVFTLHGVDEQARPMLQRDLSRSPVRLPREAPVPSRSPWRPVAALIIGAAISALGHKVRLIPPQYVKPSSSAGRMTATTPRRSARRPVVLACVWCR